MRSLITLTFASIVICPAALGDLRSAPADDRGVVLVAERPELLLPKRIARYTADGRIGRWHDYDQGGIAQDCGTELLYDSLEVDPNGDGELTCRQYGVDCTGTVACGSRWLLGGSYCNTLSLDDFTVKPGAEGALAERVEFAWLQNSDGGVIPDGAESVLIAITTFEDMELSCTSPIAQTGYGGVILDLGLVKDGFWVTDADLCTAGLDIQMPTDGSGGWLLVIAQDQVGTELILSTCAQPGLWGTKDPGAQIPGTAPWSQGHIKYDDDSPSDGTLHPWDECYSYFVGLCPDPLGNAIAFYRNDPCADFICADVNCDGAVDAEDIDMFICLLGGNHKFCCGWGGCLCDLLCTADVNRSGGLDAEDIDPFFEAVGRGGCP